MVLVALPNITSLFECLDMALQTQSIHSRAHVKQRSATHEKHYSRSGSHKEQIHEAADENVGHAEGMTETQMLDRIAQLEQREGIWASQVEHEARLVAELAKAKAEHDVALASHHAQVENLNKVLARYPQYSPMETSIEMRHKAPHPPKF